MEVEIPSIPAHQRSINEQNEEQDTIVLVVVCRARRKRKRPNACPDGIKATSDSAGERIKETKVKNEGEARDECEASMKMGIS